MGQQDQNEEKIFGKIMELIKKSEGGKSNRKNDRGGKTNCGITQRTYDAEHKQICEKKGIKTCPPAKDVYDLTDKEINDFYYRQYKQYKCDKIQDPDLQYMYFDAVVNHGPRIATKMLQRVVGVKDDGVFGKNTASAVNKMDKKEISQQFRDQRLKLIKEIIKKDKTQEANLKGWMNRYDNAQKDVDIGVISKSISQSNQQKQQQQQQMNQIGGIDCDININLLNRIKGVNKVQGRFILDDQENIKLSDLTAVLSVYNDPTLKDEYKSICFSLDPIILPNQQEFQQQEKVCWPDKYVSRNIIQDTEFAKVLFESDFLLKLMSLGVSEDGKTAFNFPNELVKLGLKSCLQDSAIAGQRQMFRFWLVPQQCTYEIKHNKYILDQVKVMCQARQVEKVNQELKDKVMQDVNDSAYKFAAKFTELYDVIAKYYPILNRLKQVFKAVALGKWMYYNKVKSDFQTLQKYQKKVNNFPKVIPIIKHEWKSEEIKLPIYYTQSEKIQEAKAYLIGKGHPTTQDLIDQVVKQIPDLKGHQTKSRVAYSQGGVNPNCQNMIEKPKVITNKKDEVIETFEEIEIPFFPNIKCQDCNRWVENDLVSLDENKCKIHNDYTCYLCFELITQHHKDAKCLPINHKKYIFHKECFDEYQEIVLSQDNE